MPPSKSGSASISAARAVRYGFAHFNAASKLLESSDFLAHLKRACDAASRSFRTALDLAFAAQHASFAASRAMTLPNPCTIARAPSSSYFHGEPHKCQPIPSTYKSWLPNTVAIRWPLATSEHGSNAVTPFSVGISPEGLAMTHLLRARDGSDGGLPRPAPPMMMFRCRPAAGDRLDDGHHRYNALTSHDFCVERVCSTQ